MQVWMYGAVSRINLLLRYSLRQIVKEGDFEHKT